MTSFAILPALPPTPLPEALVLANAVLQSVSQGVIIAGPDGLTRSSNASFSAISGYSRDELVGRPCSVLQGPETSQNELARIRKALARRERYAGLILNYRKDGSKFWNDLTIDPCTNADGTFLGFVGVVRDVTERVEHEGRTKEIIEAHKRTESFARVGGWEENLETRTWKFSDGAMHLLEIDANDPTAPQRFGDASVLNPETARIRAAAINEGKSWDLDFQTVTASGKKIWLNSRGEAILRNGKVIGLVGNLADVTERMEREARLRATLVSSPIAKLISDRAGGISYVNPAFEQLSGYSLADLESVDDLNLKMLPDPSYRHRVLSEWRRLKETQLDDPSRPYIFDATITARDGTKRDLIIYGAQVPGSAVGERISHYVDVTALRQATEQLRIREARLARILATSNDAWLELDVKSDWVERSPRWLEMLGYDENEKKEGGPDLSLIHPDDYENVSNTIRNVTNGSVVRGVVDARVRTKSGSYIFAHCRIMAERDEVGQVSLISFAATDLTEQKRTENQLARVLAATCDGWWEWDVVKNAVTRSPRWFEMFGFSQDDPRTSCLSGGLLHPDDVERLRSARKNAIETGQQTLESEYRHLRADGTYIPVLSRQIFERDDAGTVIRVSGAVTDLSKLRGAEEQLKRVISASADGWSDWDSGREKIERSPRWYEMFGYAPGAEIEAGPLEGGSGLLHPEDRARVMAELEAFKFSRDLRWETEYRQVCANGDYKPVLTKNVVVRDGSGAIVRRTSVTTDLTRIKDTEARLQRVLSATQDGWWEVDLGADRVETSARWFEIFGYDAAGLSDTNRGLSHVHPDDRAQIRDGYNAAILSGKETYKFECRHRAADGTYIPIRVSVRIGRDPAGRPIRLTGIVADLRAQKAAEVRLMAAERLEAVGMLTAGVAHDFNNLLAVITGNLELLLDEDRDAAKTPRRLRAALDSAERGAALTKDLLAFSRKQHLAPAVIDLGDEVTEAVGFFSRALPERIVTTVTGADKPIQVKVDQAKLATALLNLAFNARDAMPKGGALSFKVSEEERTVPEMSMEGSVRAGRYGVITVTDTGMGMTPEVASRVFDPFYTTKGPGKGTGLGLSMVYGFIRQSGGYVEVDSTPGNGTTIRLLLPVSDIASPSPEGVAKPPAAQSFAGRSVLVVEDLPQVREIVTEWLAAMGFEIEIATDAAEALMKVTEKAAGFDLLVTDVGLPGDMNGVDLALAINTKRPATKVVTISGYNEVIEDSGVKIPGTWIHLRKPFKRQDLLDALMSLLGEESPKKR